MLTDKEQTETENGAAPDPADDAREESLRWLLDMEVEEPQETLFSLCEEAYQDAGLTDYEAEVAARPLFRGNASSDDLTTYVSEEIVISSEMGDCSDIYARAEGPAPAVEPEPEKPAEVMAIDYSRRSSRLDQPEDAGTEGADILGLAEKDDIGEKFLTIKRVRRSEGTGSTAEQSASEAQAEVEVRTGDKVEATAEAATAATAEAEVEVTAESAASSDMSDAAADVTGQEAGEVEEQPDELPPIEYEPEYLSEAPVPSLVAAPGSFAVANEDAAATSAEEPADTAACAGAVETATDYVTGNAPPADDEDFDRYLARGENLQPATVDPDDLVVETTEGIVSVDTAADAPIDYHEDFLSMDGFEQESVSALAPVISAAMQEIAGLVGARLRERGQSEDALAVDVRLGEDPEAIRRCYAEGFEPVTSVCPALPAALGSLEQAQLETVYVRLFDSQTGESWNDLFSAEADENPVAEQEAWGDSAAIESMFDDLLVEEAGAPLAPAAPGDVVEGFGADMLAAEFDVDLTAGMPGSEPDIEEAFAEVGQPSNNADEICGVDVGEFETAAQAQDDSAEVEAVEEPVAAVDTAASVPAEQPGSGNWCVPEGIAFNYSSQSTAEVFADFLDAFIEEGSSEVEKLEDAFGEWEKNPADSAALVPVARTLHTLKGIAKGVGLQRYGTLVHNFETLLEAMPRPEEGAEAGYFRMVNAWLDAVVRGLDHVQEQRCDVASEFPQQAQPTVVEKAAPAAVPEQAAAAAVEEDDTDSQRRESSPGQVSPGQVSPGEGGEAAVSLDRQRRRQRDQKLADEGAKALASQQSVRMTAEKLDHLLNLTSQAQQLGVRSAQSTNKCKRATAELQGRLASVRSQIGAIADRALSSVNARSDRTTPDLDALEMDQYSELHEAANILREGVEDLADLIDLAGRQNAMVDALLKQQSSVITSITSSIQAARVVPVSRLMPGLRRIVRTVSTDLNKSVTFKVLNEVGALDRDHYARCQTILEHMVRNALDHGIESPEEREAQGKSATGRITIDVRKTGGEYLIRLADDGRGIDPEAIRESAYRKGLDVDLDKLSDDEVLRLIFHKGFSTASKLSEISGRGVGMDIVMSELQQLGGDIQIRSTVGLGTSFDIRIPANVTVHGALFVTAGENAYAIPLNGLIAVEQVPVREFYKAVEKGATLSLFDVECEPAYLATLCAGEGLPDKSAWGITVPVIIAGSEERYMAIAIDNVEEALELVVRSLGPQFSGVPGVAGAATTADGEAIVALDLNLLVQSLDADGQARLAVNASQESSLLALVVDDSRTQRMVATSQLETVGVETITAENGMVAIDMLNGANRLPDVVLLDVEMPVQDGIETLREIRKSRRFGDLPVIMVTSRTGAKHRAMAREAGCNGYMGKPFNFPALVEKISELTGHELQLS